MGFVALDAILDFRIEFTELTPDLQIPTRHCVVVRSSGHEILENSNQLNVRLGEQSSSLVIFDVLVDEIPADPLAIIPNRIPRTQCHMHF